MKIIFLFLIIIASNFLFADSQGQTKNEFIEALQKYKTLNELYETLDESREEILSQDYTDRSATERLVNLAIAKHEIKEELVLICIRKILEYKKENPKAASYFLALAGGERLRRYNGEYPLLYESLFEHNNADAAYGLSIYYYLMDMWLGPKKGYEEGYSKKDRFFLLKSAEMGSFWGLLCTIGLYDSGRITLKKDREKAIYFNKKFLREVAPTKFEWWKECESRNLDFLIREEKIGYISALNYMALCEMEDGRKESAVKYWLKAFEEFSNIPDKSKKYYKTIYIDSLIANIAILYYHGIGVEKDEYFANALLSEYISKDSKKDEVLDDVKNKNFTAIPHSGGDL